jgi:hypothetical protein
MARENLENLYRKINIREKGSEIATEQRKVEETGPKEKIEEKEPLPVNKTQESATDLINIDPEQLKELENALDKPLSELSDRPLNKLQESELLISLEKLIMPLRQYVDYLRNNLEGLNSEQLKQELFRVSSLNNVLDQRLEELPVNDITQNLHNELKNLKVSYREIKNKIEISPIDSSSEKSEKRSSGKRKLSTEEKWQEDLSTYSIAGLKEEQENVNLKIDNLNKALESKTDNMNDRNLVEKEVGNLKKKLEIINKILLKEAPEPTTQQKPIDDIGIPEEVQEVPLTTYEQIKAKEEEIQRAEDRMAIYRPIGWFRKKPVVRDLGYYGLEADLNRLKGELKDLHTEAERKAKQAGKFEKELGKAQKTIFKNVAKEIIQEEKTGKKKTGFWKKLFSSKPERILTDEQILESVNKDRKFKKSMRKRYKTKYKE